MAEQPNRGARQAALARLPQPAFSDCRRQRAEGRGAGREGSGAPLSLPAASCQAGSPRTQGCPAGWVPPHQPGCTRVGELFWVLAEPRAGTDPVGGWHPCRGHPGVVQGGCCLLQRRAGGLIRAPPAWGEEGQGGNVAPRGSGARVRNSSRHVIYHRRRAGKLLYKRISSAGRAGLHGPWAASRRRGHRRHLVAPTGWAGRNALGTGNLVPAGLCPRARSGVDVQYINRSSATAAAVLQGAGCGDM